MIVGDVGEWWGGCEEETKWLDRVESTMADHRPLAGSVAITKTQKEKNEVSASVPYMHTWTYSFTYIYFFPFRK